MCNCQTKVGNWPSVSGKDDKYLNFPGALTFEYAYMHVDEKSDELRLQITVAILNIFL